MKSNNALINFLGQYILVPVIFVIAIVIIIPIFLIINLFSRKNSGNKKTENEFETEFESDDLIIERKFIDYYVKEVEDLELDFGLNDYVFKFRTTPKIDEIEELFFDMNFFETEIGFFLISINQIPNGMTLWFLDKEKIEFKKVRDLVSADWDFKGENNKVIVFAETEKEEINLEINIWKS
ncbi:MAG: hypothetical protein J6N74_08370 [Chryseobacterium sp.]|nr:hypothetical protein [Chryseobacterium sp.]